MAKKCETGEADDPSLVEQANRQPPRQMTDVLANWPGTVEHKAAVGAKAVEEANRDRTNPGRDAISRKRQRLDVAIVAEAARLGKVLASSIEFAGELRPGVREGLGLSREGRGWPSKGTIKLAIFRVKSAKTDRISPTSAKTDRISR